MVPAVALSMRTGMSRLDTRELHRRQLMVRVLRNNLSKGADAIGITGAVEQHPHDGQQRTGRAVDRRRARRDVVPAIVHHQDS
jgi:hypothetical protein